MKDMNRLFPLLLLPLLLGISAGAAAKSAHRHAHKAPPPFASRAEVRAFVAEMHDKHDFDRAHLTRAFARTRPLKAVIQAVLPPRDPSVRSWQEYRARFVEPQRIERGLRFWQAHQAELAAAGADSGVPPEYIVAIIGVESIYGRHTGNFNTFAALATLAFDYPKINPATDATRAALFRHELEELLLLAREAQRDPLSYQGSYAGALGLPQFLPSSIRNFARDGDDDGRIDLANSPADAIASVANFLKAHGWEKDGPVTVDARVSGERYGQLIDEGIRPNRKPGELVAFGVTSDGTAPELPCALIDLVTPQEPAAYRLGFQNFFVITRYNRSSFYAMAVHDLAQTLRAARQQTPSDAAGIP
mgnify:CR=1 FL=1